jgi:hypothetical protein|tara:strand:+ start:3696 stop:3893 length:198 start_codon:yes stop_codon:yes gene_type:complete
MDTNKHKELKETNDMSDYEQIQFQAWCVSNEFMNLIGMINKLPPEQAEHITEMFGRILNNQPKEK